jgi:hypothetical protein
MGLLERKVEVVIGKETDSDLLDLVEAAVVSLGGTMTESSYSVVGSQEVLKYRIRISGATLTLSSETFIGFTLRGASSQVQTVVDLLNASGS